MKYTFWAGELEGKTVGPNYSAVLFRNGRKYPRLPAAKVQVGDMAYADKPDADGCYELRTVTKIETSEPEAPQ